MLEGGRTPLQRPDIRLGEELRTVEGTSRGGPTEPGGFMLAQHADEPFDSPDHIFEVLWDGLRALAFLQGGTIRLRGRYGRDLTPLFPEIVRAAAGLTTDAVVDGAIVALDGDGRPAFGPVAARLMAGEPDGPPTGFRVAFHAFDILSFQGRPVVDLALVRRKEILRRAVRGGGIIYAPDFVTGEGLLLFEAARAFGVDGIVAKDLRSPYLPGVRSSRWLVISPVRRGRFVIAGYTYGGRWTRRHTPRAEGPFSSLLLGAWDGPGQLRYVGEVTGSFGDTALAIARRLEPLTTRQCPFPQEPAVRRLVFWCQPSLCARVRFAGWNPDRTLRFPIFEALRPDVPASVCRLEDAGG